MYFLSYEQTVCCFYSKLFLDPFASDCRNYCELDNCSFNACTLNLVLYNTAEDLEFWSAVSGRQGFRLSGWIREKRHYFSSDRCQGGRAAVTWPEGDPFLWRKKVLSKAILSGAIKPWLGKMELGFVSTRAVAVLQTSQHRGPGPGHAVAAAWDSFCSAVLHIPALLS